MGSHSVFSLFSECPGTCVTMACPLSGLPQQNPLLPSPELATLAWMDVRFSQHELHGLSQRLVSGIYTYMLTEACLLLLLLCSLPREFTVRN